VQVQAAVYVTTAHVSNKQPLTEVFIFSGKSSCFYGSSFAIYIIANKEYSKKRRIIL